VARYACLFYTFGWIAASLLVVVGFALLGRATGAMWIGWTGGFAVIAFTLLLRGTFYWLAWSKRRALPPLMILPVAFLWLEWSWITPLAAEVLLIVPVFMVLACSMAPGGKGPRLAAALFVPAYRVAFCWLVPINNAMCRLRARIGPGRDLFRGMTHLEEGQLERAVEAFERHLRRNPTEMAGVAYASMAFAKLGRHDEALRYLDAALQQGAQADALVFRCLTLLAVGATEEALQDVNAALRRRPNNPRFCCFRALAFLQADRVDEALEVLNGPGRPEKFHLNWWPLSLALQEKGETAAAADARCRALPFLATMRMLGPMPWDEAGEASVLARMGKLDQGERAVARTLARNPDDPDALLIQALIRALRGEMEDVLKPLERASQRNPFVVVQAARDPAFALLRRSVWFAPLLERAQADWQAQLLAIRSRPGLAASGP
jgi:tetratricopeptide (TPR) repeat protein